ncbi:MAG: protein-glutamate O-methyltransferase CheR [Myxococcota bacterium]|nr:protein-glutamate O-methyltransferase CheR [Myxococcota bacterium]
MFGLLQSFLLGSVGIVLHPKQQFQLELRLLPFLEQHNIFDPVAFLKNIRIHPLQDDLVEAFTTNETYFFRGPHTFQGLIKHVLPNLLKENPSRKLRILSAACSSGQEVYSIAIHIRSHIPSLEHQKVEICGIDIDRAVLKKAEEGWYSQFEINRGMPTKYIFRYFEREGRGYRVKDNIKQMTKFVRSNLLHRFPAQELFDVIFLRNVLIYFSEAEQKRQLLKMSKLLRPKGVLFVGSTEILPKNPYFKRIQKRNMVWYQATT